MSDSRIHRKATKAINLTIFTSRIKKEAITVWIKVLKDRKKSTKLVVMFKWQNIYLSIFFLLLLFPNCDDPFSNCNALSVITKYCYMPTKKDRPLFKQDYLELYWLILWMNYWSHPRLKAYTVSFILFKFPMKPHKVPLKLAFLYHSQQTRRAWMWHSWLGLLRWLKETEHLRL